MSSLSSADPMPFDCGRASSRARFHPRSQLRKIEWLTAAAQARDCDWVRRALVQIVPEYDAQRQARTRGRRCYRIPGTQEQSKNETSSASAPRSSPPCYDAMNTLAERHSRAPILAKVRQSNSCRASIGSAVFLTLMMINLSAWAEYRIQQGDTIEISVAGIPELRQRTTVQPDGAIAFPLVGAVAVEGLTPAELRTAAQTQLARKIYRMRGNDGKEILTVIQQDDVSAAIVGYRPLYVTGDVAKPGEQTFWPNMSVRQALALAGGAVPPQARFPKPSRDLSALKTDYGSSFVEFAQATAEDR